MLDSLKDDHRNTPLEAWAGVECTVNRVGDVYHDQSVRTGHHDRLAQPHLIPPPRAHPRRPPRPRGALGRRGPAAAQCDPDRVPPRGATRLRYPVLWGRVAPGALADADWSWT